MADLPDSLRQLYDNLIKHLEALEADPSRPLQEALLDECTSFLTVPLSYDRRTTLELIALSSSLLPKVQQDPQPLVRLLSRLVRHFTFEEILSLQPPVDFVSGLNVSAQPYNELMLELLFKATKRGQDAAILAGLAPVILAMVNLWLCAPDIRISNMAARVMVALLTVDHGDTPAAVDNIASSENLVGHGQGLVWKRIFGDKNVYELMFACTSLKPLSNQEIASPQLTKAQRTVAQTRLMSILPEIGKLDWEYITTSHHSDIEALYGLPTPNTGLVEYVCSYMADWSDDILIYMNLLDTFAKLIVQVRQVSPKNHNRSVALEYLIDRGLHQRNLSILLEPHSSQNSSFEPFEKRLLLAPAALYLAQFASTYKEDFLSSVALRPTLERVTRELNVSPAKWTTGTYSVSDLQVLASLPRIVLLPVRTSQSRARSSPLLAIPASRANASALNALSIIFSGLSNVQQIENLDPEHNSAPNMNNFFPHMEIYPGPKATRAGFWDNKDTLAEASATYAAYHVYTTTHPNFLQDLTLTADLVAMAGNAIAAIKLFEAIVQAHWAPLPSLDCENPDQLPKSTHDLPSHRQASIPEKLQSFIFPETADGEARYSLAPLRSFFATPSTMRFFDWLLRPPRTFSNLVGGGGDPEGSAFQIASAKHDLLRVVSAKLKQLEEKTGNDDLLPTGKPFRKHVQILLEQFDRRLHEGVWGPREVGSRIATLEM